MTTALEQARKNVAHAEEYLRTMTEARKDAEYREKVAKSLLKQAREVLENHTTSAKPQEPS